jgi:XTP/dITP diphosphohydrolase
MKKIILATANQHKVDELKQILSDLPLQFLTIKDYPGLVMPEEDCPDFAGNAAKKAEAVSAFTDEIALADDSGLEVEALEGRPGVYSARYAGREGDYEANNRLLLKELEGLSPAERKARFVSVIAIAVPGDQTYLVEGSCPGLIIEQYRGEGGFGYDPLFLYEPAGLTFAEMPAEEKNKVSHRARALQGARNLLLKIISR